MGDLLPQFFSLLHPDRHQVSLIVLIGLPGSGKTTLTRLFVQQCPERRVISTDAIRAELFGDESIQGDWLKIQQAIERRFRQTAQYGQKNPPIQGIYDATNVVRKQRRQAIRLSRACGFTHVTGVWLNTPLDLCLERNRQRHRQVPEDVILSMHRRLMGAPPSLVEDMDRLLEIGRSLTLQAIADRQGLGCQASPRSH